MKVIDMRMQLCKRYPNGIRGKPITDMPEDQVIAIYRSVIERESHEQIKLTPTMNYEQMKMELDN